MKKLFFVAVLFISLSGFGQPSKDSLLIKNKAAVTEMLTLMHYLDRCTTEYFKMTADEKSKSDKDFSSYYQTTIVANNPVPSLSISEYLGYNEGYIPPAWQYFIEPVYNKNASELIKLTEIYGYPSTKRVPIIISRGEKLMPTVFIIRTDAYDKQLKKLLRHEYKAGNIDKKEYTAIKMFMKKDSQVTLEDLKRTGEIIFSTE